MPPHVARLRVRYDETDQMGVVYHGRYFAYFEVGRTELMRSCGLPYAEMERGGLRLVVVEASARYLAPTRYDQEVEVRTRLTQLTAVRVVFTYELAAGAAVVATGSTALACVDPAGRPTRLPEPFARILKEAGKRHGIDDNP